MKSYKIFLALLFCLGAVWQTGCQIQQEQGTEETELPDIQIATINIASEEVPETLPPAVSESVEQPAVVTTPPETAPTEAVVKMDYNSSSFDKVVFASFLAAIGEKTQTMQFLVSDPDRDGKSEFLVSLPDTDTHSQNLIFESLDNQNLYYNDGAGVENDYFVMESTTGNVFLNENTRNPIKETTTPEGVTIISGGETVSQEYFRWTGSQWESNAMLYNGTCYWNYEPVTADVFWANSANMQAISSPEDIFNIYVGGTPDQAAEAFFDYLSAYFKLDKPVSADIDGNGSTEQVIFIQNMPKNWCSHVNSLYKKDTPLDLSALNQVHTTCFVFDFAPNGFVRIRSENFDRKYSFSSSKGKLYAYDDTNSMQTIQYSSENDGYGKHFMAMMWG